jgi:hypothetical protein
MIIHMGGFNKNEGIAFNKNFASNSPN